MPAPFSRCSMQVSSLFRRLSLDFGAFPEWQFQFALLLPQFNNSRRERAGALFYFPVPFSWCRCVSFDAGAFLLTPVRFCWCRCVSVDAGALSFSIWFSSSPSKRPWFSISGVSYFYRNYHFAVVVVVVTVAGLTFESEYSRVFSRVLRDCISCSCRSIRGFTISLSRKKSNN